MILRGIHVENWRCIRRLDLENLPAGIVVLHGPNRTGKSSLVLALRACLFDADHDSAAPVIKDSIPRNGGGPPKVVVEFTTSGATYQLTKVFSKKKDGGACLRKQAGQTWQIEQDAPKEASRRARELLGADKSTAGLNQLLWLSQGDIRLPAPGKLDQSLEEKIAAVVGVLVTERDFGFRQALDQRCARWFTPQGRCKERSPITECERVLNERIKARDDERKIFEKCEDALRRLQACDDELPSRRRDVKAAETEMARLHEECEYAKARLQRYREAEHAVKTSAQAVQQARETLDRHQRAQARFRDSQAKRKLGEEIANAAAARHKTLRREHEEHATLLANARKTEEDHARGRDDIADRQRLWTIAREDARLESSLQTALKHESEIAELEASLEKSAAPDEKALQGLRANRRKAASLRAQLEAVGANLVISPRQSLNMEIAIDGQDTKSVQLHAGSRAEWRIGQRARLTLGEIGVIELIPICENLDFDGATHDLAKLDRDYPEAVRSFQEEPADEACLDRLSEARHARDARARRLAEVRQELTKAVPNGRGSAEAERTMLAKQRRVIVERRPDLADWQPDQADIDDREAQFKKQADQLEKTRKEHEANAKVTLSQLQSAETDLQMGKEELAAVGAALESARQEAQRLGDEAALRKCVDLAEQGLAAAERALANTKLTEAEQTVDERLHEAQTALDERRRRLRELEDVRKELGGFLLGNEGLHYRLAAAETAVHEAETALARERLEAEAHKRLCDLFEECRENQVQHVMGPIAGRVLDWARMIGLCDYQEVRFGDRFMPEGIVTGLADVAQPIVFDDESYGTAEQLSLLVRLALGGVLAKEEPLVAILDDPLAHADINKHRAVLKVLRVASEGGPAWNPPAGRLQIIVLTCHPDRFDYLPGAAHVNLEQLINR